MESTTIRRLPGPILARMIRRAGLTQFDIARDAEVSQPYVSAVINRRAPQGERTERVWVVLEQRLGKQDAA